MSQDGIPINYYERLPKSVVSPQTPTTTTSIKNEKKKESESFKKHRLNQNFRMVLNGKTSSGKTNTLIDLLVRMNDVFDLIVLVTPMTNEPFYQHLQNILPEDRLHVYKHKKDKLPRVEDYEHFDGKMIAIFDDMMTACKKDQELITNFYSFGRKLGATKGGFCSCVYISQHFFNIPIAIRANCDYVILKQMSDEDDKFRLKVKFGKRLTTQQFYNMFEYCTTPKESFMLIDILAPQKQRFRRGWLEIIDPNDFDPIHENPIPIKSK